MIRGRQSSLLACVAAAFLASAVQAQDTPGTPEPRPAPTDGQPGTRELRKPGNSAAGAARRALPRSASQMLDARLLELQLTEAPLEQALQQLAEQLRVNVIVRWTALESAGVARDTPISLRVRNVRVSQALWLILSQAAGTDSVLAWRADSELLTISTAADLGSELIVRVYDVQDIIATRLARPSIGIDREREFVAGLQPRVAAGAVGVQPITDRWRSGVRFSGEDVGGEETRDGQGGDPEARMRELINVITAVIEPESWDVNGGAGTVRPFRGRLVVRNTLAVHQMIGGPILE